MCQVVHAVQFTKISLWFVISNLLIVFIISWVACAHVSCIPSLSGLFAFTCSSSSIWSRCVSSGLMICLCSCILHPQFDWVVCVHLFCLRSLVLHPWFGCGVSQVGCWVACAHVFLIPRLTEFFAFTCSASLIWLWCVSSGLWSCLRSFFASPVCPGCLRSLVLHPQFRCGLSLVCCCMLTMT